MAPSTEEIISEMEELGLARLLPYDGIIPEVVRYYDRASRPISFRDWALLRMWSERHESEYVRVAEDMAGPYWVSTVWLGLNHNFIGDGPPLIFETMVFNQETAETDVDDMCRYSSETEALEGHRIIVERVRLLHDATSQLEGASGDG